MTTGRSASDRWLLRQPADLPMRLFCFPHAGAGASAYGSWAGALASAGVDVCPVQLPGRENRFREPRHHRLEPLLEALVSALQRHLDRPYALFGHSLGALLAYELARFLSGVGVGPDRLLVSGRIAPQLSDPRPPMHGLPDAELVARLRELGGIPDAVLESPELLALQLPTLRADLAVNETYRHVPGPPLDLPVTAFGGDRDPKVAVAELHAWRRTTRAGFRASLLPGDHFFVARNRDLLLKELGVDLALSPVARPGRG
ncbi:MAG TPA: alpha/beta fold hydrolase [Pedococcus sp.]|nr:alpha/beta fold hydrolase [Pedococcus sp.]